MIKNVFVKGKPKRGKYNVYISDNSQIVIDT